MLVAHNGVPLKRKKNIPLINPTLGKFILSPQEKRQDVLTKIPTSDLSIQRPTLYHLSYPDKIYLSHLLDYIPH
jgi:hypothetical protein